MTFVADCMLGKLARWLRALGLDVAYFRRIGDDELLNIARKEGRTLLTRDTALYARARGVSRLFIESEKWDRQVVQLLRAFRLRDKLCPHTRCLECNVPLKSLSRAAARNLVAPFVLDHAQSFSLCPACGRVFWKGTHLDDMGAKIARILEDAEKNEPAERSVSAKGRSRRSSP
jgi:uncharacterized protein